MKGAREWESYLYDGVDLLFSGCKNIHVHHISAPEEPNPSNIANGVSCVDTVIRQSTDDIPSSGAAYSGLSNHHNTRRVEIS